MSRLDCLIHLLIVEKVIKNMKILIVEDDDRIAKPLAEDLKHQYHAVELASDGVEGWEYTQATEFDLILLDLMLPKLDGISLCKQLRKARYKALILMHLLSSTDIFVSSLLLSGFDESDNC